MASVERDYASGRLEKRPSEDAIEILRHTPPANISDFLTQIGIVNYTIKGVKPLTPFKEYKNHIAGPAFTMQMAPVNEAYPYYDAPYMFMEIIEQGEAGDVLVIAGQGAPYGFWGDHTTVQAMKQNLEAVVIDGCTRDSRPIRDTGYPLFTAGVALEAWVRRYDAVGYNVPVVAGGVMVRPGDIIVGDDDGVVVIPQEVLDQVLEGVARIAEIEDAIDAAMAADQPWSQIYDEVHHLKYLPQRGSGTK